MFRRDLRHIFMLTGTSNALFNPILVTLLRNILKNKINRKKLDQIFRFNSNFFGNEPFCGARKSKTYIFECARKTHRDGDFF